MARTRTLDYKLTTLPPVWPGVQTPEYQRIKAPFKTPLWSAIIQNLARETSMLGARQIEIALDVSPFHLRQDGQLRSDARPAPPVIVSFLDREGQRHAYPADGFRWFQDNLHAISVVLSDLRRAERYRVSSRLIRAGFKSIPSSTAATLSTMDAATILAEETDFSALAITADVRSAKDAVRRAMAAAHPDRNGGDRTRWDRVEKARSVLSSHHGVTV